MKKKRNKVWLSIAMLALFIGVTTFAIANEKADYRLAAGDTVRVTVYGHEDLSGEFTKAFSRSYERLLNNDNVPTHREAGDFVGRESGGDGEG